MPFWRRLARWILFSLGERTEVFGFEVRAILLDRTSLPTIINKLTSALELLATHAPVRLAALRRDVSQIVVLPLPNLASYTHWDRVCMLNCDVVTWTKAEPDWIALLLVHEGTHARLRRAGFGNEDAVRARIERICITAELIVAQRLPNAKIYKKVAEARLDRPPSEYTDEARRLRESEHLDTLGANLRRNGVAGRFLYWISRPIIRALSGRAA